MLRPVLFSLAAAIALNTANAVPIISFGEDLSPGETLPTGGNADLAHSNFLNSISQTGTDDMESFAAGTTAPLTLNFTGSAGPVTAELTGTGTRPPFDAVWGSSFDGRFATSGTQYWQTSDQFDLAFSNPISAFGFFATDGGDGPGQLTLRLTINGGGTEDVVIPHTVGPSADGAVMFFGFTDLDRTYSNISFLNSDSGHDFIGFDDWTIGTPVSVPEPGSLALMVVGLIGLGLRRRHH